MWKKLHDFENGILTDAYTVFGSFVNKKSVTFRVWAPNAKSVSVVGDFNGWNRDCHKMENIGYGVWQTEIEKISKFTTYK